MTDFIQINRPKSSEIPVLINFPHSGTQFPQEVQSEFKQRYLECPEDADWHLPSIYDFAEDLGITTVATTYSRYVVDLNRNPEGNRLYNDNRKETQIIAEHSFAGDPLYETQYPNEDQRKQRVSKYFTPYYEALNNELERLQKKFGKVLLFDAHSIRHRVPRISAEPFPHFILGNADQTSCRPETFSFIAEQISNFKRKDQSLSLNNPFKGGHITRSFHQLENNRETIQLEMCQNLYMDETTFELTTDALELKNLLKNVFTELAKSYETI